MNVTLRPELEKLIEAEVKSGRSTDSSQFLNRAVYHYVVARDLGEEYTQLRAYSAERRRPAA